MTTAKKASARKATRSTSTASKPNAIRLLTQDHREVKGLFQDYQELVDHDADDDDKHAVARQICSLLSVHAQIEEEIFYPAAVDSLGDDELIDEATVEHTSAKDLIAQLESSDPSAELFDAKVKVLGEYIDHHVREEERQLFPRVRKAKADLEGLGDQLMERKQALMQQSGLVDEPVQA